MPVQKLFDTPDDRHKQHTIIKQHLTRATRLRLPATLTIEEWITTLNDFNGMCAYCQQQPYKVLEHFIPIVLGGSTAIGNVLPSCYSCNSFKLNHHPEAILADHILERLTPYLQRNGVAV